MMQFREVIDFWFSETGPRQWWVKDAAFDQRIAERFAGVLARAKREELSHWRKTPQGRLAEIIVLDQFSRNIHRDTAEAFAADPLALQLHFATLDRSLCEAACLEKAGCPEPFINPHLLFSLFAVSHRRAVPGRVH